MGLCYSILVAQDGDEDVVPFRGSGGQVHALIVALDYSYSPGHELSCTKDAQAMLRMLQRAGVQDVNLMTDHHLGMPGFPTREEVLRGLKTVARRGQPGDWFFWFFAGHGVNVPDSQGEEADGQDEAFVTPSDMGKLSQKSLLIDDTFAEALDRCVPEGVRILCVCDCCHSGSICDIDSYRYRHEIYQIAASQDDQVAEDTGQGGLLTQALRRTILVESIRHRDDDFSIQNVVDLVLRHAHRMSRSQDVSFQYSGTDPRRVAWPMCFPWTEYLHLANDNIEAYELDLDVENP